MSQSILLPWGTKLYHRGPDLTEGKLPALFYFSIAGDESLDLDPFNQPVVALEGKPLRVFSLTLPEHGPGFDKRVAVDSWAAQVSQGSAILADFIDEVLQTISHLIDQQIVSEFALAGLSRGAFIATHIASRDARAKAVCGFAPMCNLARMRGMAGNPHVDGMHLKHLIPFVKEIPFWFSIGDNDEMVGTEAVKELAEELGAELTIHPSIGRKGHGTPPEIFQAGAEWVASFLS